MDEVKKKQEAYIRLLEFEITKHLDKQNTYQYQITLLECKFEKQTRDLNELQAKLTLAITESSQKDEALLKLEKEAAKLVSCL